MGSEMASSGRTELSCPNCGHLNPRFTDHCSRCSIILGQQAGHHTQGASGQKPATIPKLMIGLYAIGAILILFSIIVLSSNGYCQWYGLGGSCHISGSDIKQEFSDGNLALLMGEVGFAIGLPMLIIAEYIRSRRIKEQE